jgi:membrane protein implicated in regulation of membrane protease activity
MNWEIFYLTCFVAGFVFSVLSFVTSAFHLHIHMPKHFHLGGFGHGVGHAPAAAGGHAGQAAHGHSSPAKGGAKSGAKGMHFSFFNPMTMAAFLTWFGGTGYLLVHLRHIWVFAGLLLASVAGLIAASIVFWFVAKVLMKYDGELDPLDYEMVGVLGRVSSTVRPDGTGEIIFLQVGARKACPARSETGEPLAKGTEVVVTRYESGVAYVRAWDELAGADGASTQQQTDSNSKEDLWAR